MLRVFQEDKITVTHFYPGQDQLQWRPIHRFLFRSLKTRSYGYNDPAFLKLENEGSQNVAHSVTDYIDTLGWTANPQKKFLDSKCLGLDEAWKL